MRYISPQNIQDINQRNQLISLSLRPKGLPFKIDDEYPIVLDRKNSSMSHCITSDGRIVGHANLWKRSLLLEGKKTDKKIGLIGNVATDPRYRGQGVMKKLFNELYKIANSSNLHALILWSDLYQFYQNLGFRSLGKERRFTLSLKKLKAFSEIDGICELADPQQLSPLLLKDLINLRPKLDLTLDRSASEFKTLLSIPETHLFISYKNKLPTAYAIVGKGFDMIGVIHEWGGYRFEELAFLFYTLMDHYQTPEILLLSPQLDTTWDASFQKISNKSEIHPMALYKEITPDCVDLQGSL